MATDAEVEAAWSVIQACGQPVGAGDGGTYIPRPPTKNDVRRALEAAEKAAAWQEARVTAADFVSDDTRDEDDERPEGCYVTVRLPLNTEIRAGIARVILPTPPEAP